MARHFPPLQYRNLLTLKGLHRSPLVALAFNLKGTLLATADSGAVEDGTWRSHLVVWEMASTHGLRQYRFAVKCSYGLAALIWAEDIGIIVAGQDGSITVVQESFVQRKVCDRLRRRSRSFLIKQVHVLTFDAHVSAVSSIAFNAVTRLVATAATDGLKVWKGARHPPSNSSPLMLSQRIGNGPSNVIFIIHRHASSCRLRIGLLLPLQA